MHHHHQLMNEWTQIFKLRISLSHEANLFDQNDTLNPTPVLFNINIPSLNE